MGIPAHTLDLSTTVSGLATLAASITLIMLAVLLAVKQTHTRLRTPRLVLTRFQTYERGDRDLGTSATYDLRAALRQLRSEDSARVDLSLQPLQMGGTGLLDDVRRLQVGRPQDMEHVRDTS